MCNYLSTSLAFEVLCILLLVVQANGDTVISDKTLESVFGTPTAFNLTSRNQASSDTKWLEYNTTRLIGGKICCVPTLTRSDYVIVPDVGAYKIHAHKTTWDNARKICLAEGGVPPVVNMNGNYNYQAAQQVFFISGAPQTVTKGMKNCVTYLERDDYSVRPGIGVHKMHKRRVNWNKARKSCMEEGGSLAILNSALEETTLLNWMRSESVERVWLGVHDQFEEGVWLTLSGERLDSIGYEKWSKNPWPNQPDNYGGRQNCAVLIKEEGMDDVECDHLHAYMCEINLC